MGYWEGLPTVVAALKRGPGTWDRKPMKKDKAYDVDEILAKMAGRPEASKQATWDALRTISKELLDVSPKSLKNNLASRIALKNAKPPASGGNTPPPEEDEPPPFVDDL